MCVQQTMCTSVQWILSAVNLLLILLILFQVKQEYVDFLLHCYIDAEVDNKETFTKEFMWNLFDNFGMDIDQVNIHTHACTHTHTNIKLKLVHCEYLCSNL